MTSSERFDKSVLHHWLYLSKDSTFDCIGLLDYLSERDFGVLDISLSDKALRPLYINHLAKYYATHELIIARYFHKKSHLDWIINRGLNLHVRKLAISFNEHTNPISFDEYILNFPELLEIKCWYITNTILDMLSIYSPKLQSFRALCGLHRLNDYNKIENFLRNCTHLDYIQISDDPGADFCRLGDDVIAMIGKYCPHLEVLRLKCWANISEVAIYALANLTNLTELDIDIFDEMPSDSLVRLVSNNRRLESLTLDGMCWPHDEVRALGVSCQLLKHIGLYVCHWQEFTDEGVIAMVQGCPLLETIVLVCGNAGPYIDYDDVNEEGEMRYVEQVLSFTDASLFAIAQYCPSLEVLNIGSVDPLSYTKAGLDALVASCSRLRALHTDDKLYYSVKGYVPCNYDDLYYAEVALYL